MTSEAVEIRVKVPRFAIDVLDGISMAAGSFRNELIAEILMDYAEKKHHEASLVLKLAGDNPRKLDR